MYDSLILTGAIIGSMNDRQSYPHKEGWRSVNSEVVGERHINFLSGA